MPTPDDLYDAPLRALRFKTETTTDATTSGGVSNA